MPNIRLDSAAHLCLNPSRKPRTIMVRTHVLRAIGVRLAALPSGHPLRVGIDGVDASGKTSFANELAAVLTELGRSVIRSSIDGFHNPAHVRRRLGSNSPEGYFLDSFNNKAIVDLLLRPLGPKGSLEFRPAIFDLDVNVEVSVPVERA